jgi:RimJ/RimL family protein N-acetyltransferase
MTRRNELGQPIGEPVEGWAARPRPPREPIEGRFCRVEPLDPARHAEALFEANRQDAEDPLFHAIVDRASGRALGAASYLRIEPAIGVIEVGHIAYSPALQRTPAATEAMYLLMRRVFDELGYRRYEWKCDALNAPSRAAADRLGFRFEGVFRQATVYKGRNRDTAWYAVSDKEWPERRAAFEAWLDPGNFDAGGRQRRPLVRAKTAGTNGGDR